MQLNARVQFEQPDLNRLSEKHTVVDMHFHSCYSDGMNRIHKIVDRARKLGIGIAITDHNAIRGALEIDAYTDVLTIPGIEITAAEGAHLLVYFYDCESLQAFYDKHVAPFLGLNVMSSLNLTMAQILERTQEYRCLPIFAHPYCAMYTGVCNPQFSPKELERLLRMAAGVEAINANNLNKWNLKCALLGFNLQGAMVGGSDGHSLGHMGRAVSYAPGAKNREDFLETVRHQQNGVMGKEIDLLRKVAANSCKLGSNLHNCNNLVEKNFRYGCRVVQLKSHAIRRNLQRRLQMRHPVPTDAGM